MTAARPEYTGVAVERSGRVGVGMRGGVGRIQLYEPHRCRCARCAASCASGGGGALDASCCASELRSLYRGSVTCGWGANERRASRSSTASPVPSPSTYVREPSETRSAPAPASARESAHPSADAAGASPDAESAAGSGTASESRGPVAREVRLGRIAAPGEASHDSGDAGLGWSRNGDISSSSARSRKSGESWSKNSCVSAWLSAAWSTTYSSCASTFSRMAANASACAISCLASDSVRSRKRCIDFLAMGFEVAFQTLPVDARLICCGTDFLGTKLALDLHERIVEGLVLPLIFRRKCAARRFDGRLAENRPVLEHDTDIAVFHGESCQTRVHLAAERALVIGKYHQGQIV